MRKSLLALTTALASVVACSASPETEPDSIGSHAQAIIGGKASTSDQNAVVLIMHVDRESQSFGSCTGTLIAPNLVLTARHCVSDTNATPFGCDEDGTALGTGGNAGKDMTVGGFNIFLGTDRPSFYGGRPEVAAKGKKVFHDKAKSLCGHDLALILLDREIPEAPIMRLRLDAPPKTGETLTAVGWGVTQQSDFPSKRQQRSGVKVIAVGPVKASFKGGAVPPNDFEVGEAICSGDSGGPGIAEVTGAVMGVVSRGGNGNSDADNPSAGCVGKETTNVYTSVAPFKELIESAFEEAGHEPWIEGGPDPRLAKLDVECADDSACRSNKCVANRCVQTCTETSECPSGLECGSADKICKAPAPPANAASTSAASTGCVASAAGPVGPVAPWVLAALGMLVARRRRRN